MNCLSVRNVLLQSRCGLGTVFNPTALGTITPLTDRRTTGSRIHLVILLEERKCIYSSVHHGVLGLWCVRGLNGTLSLSRYWLYMLGEIDMTRTLTIYWKVMVGLISWVVVGSDEMLDWSFKGPGQAYPMVSWSIWVHACVKESRLKKKIYFTII